MKRKVTVAWGLNGLTQVSSSCSTCIIVDVLSFSTAVTAGCAQGAQVFPYVWKDERAHAFARSVGAELAVHRQDRKSGKEVEVPSLSPVSLVKLKAGDKLVLPSPNGSTLSVHSEAKCTLAGCLRNASAVAKYVSELGEDVAVVAAGERWPDGSLRVALEDFVGSGAIVSALNLTADVEAMAAQAIFDSIASDVLSVIRATQSGRELIRRGYDDDVVFAAQLNSCESVPLLDGESFRDATM